MLPGQSMCSCTTGSCQNADKVLNIYIYTRVHISLLFQVRQMHRLNSYSLQPKMGSDGYRSLRSLGDGGHVARFGRQVTASPVPSLSPVLFLWKPNGLAVCNITFCLFSHIFERFFSITGIIRCVSGFNRHLPSRHQVAHFRSRHSINAVTPHSPPLLATPEL